MAESVSLALLENLVHMSRLDFPTNYVLISALIPDQMEVLQIDNHATPQQAGDAWFDSKATAVLRVSSIVVPGESNFLLNPAHPDFGRIVIEPARPFAFDPRLFA